MDLETSHVTSVTLNVTWVYKKSHIKCHMDLDRNQIKCQMSLDRSHIKCHKGLEKGHMS